MRRIAITAALVAAAVGTAAPAFAAWSAAASGSGKAGASTLGTVSLNAGTCATNTPDNTHNQISLSWSAVTNATSYDVYRQVSPATSFTLLKNVTGTSTTDNVTQVSNTTYTYELKARVGTNWQSASFSGQHGGRTNSQNVNCNGGF